MEQITSPTTAQSAQSIQDVNAALLAQYKAKQAATQAKDSSGASFASTLQGIERKELPAPTALAPVAKSAAPKQEEPSVAVQTEEDADSVVPKISRSARMASAEKTTEVETDDDFSLDDLVDLVNPFQHIPVLGTIYRAVTGDTIKPDVQIAGSIAFGLATGSVLLSAASGIASAIMEQNTGKEPLVQVADALFGDTVGVPDPITEPKVVVADASAQSAAASEPALPSVPEAAPVSQVMEKKEIAAQNAATTAPLVAPHKATQNIAQTALASTGGMRVGNVVYTSPMLRSAAKVQAASRTQQAPTAQQSTQATASAVPPKTASETAAVASETPDTTLGALIHEQAKARDAGQPLPPELVQDMMLRALDKYKTAHATGQTETMSVQ